MCLSALSIVSTLLISPVTLSHEPSAQVSDHVNVISGDLQPTIDHVVIGPEPIALCLDAHERLTVKVTPKRGAAIFTLFDEFGVTSDWALPEKWGLHADHPREWTMTQRLKPWNTNADSGVISRERPVIHYRYAGYTFTLVKPNGERRVYRCFNPASDKLKRAIAEKRNKDTLFEVFRLSEVRLPNGNQLIYTYDGEHLTRIEAASRTGEVLTWAEISQEGGIAEVSGSDGVVYRHESRADVATDDWGRVVSCGETRYSYDYDRCSTTVQVGERVYLYRYSPEGKILSVSVDGVEECFHWRQRRLEAKTLSYNGVQVYRRDFGYNQRGDLISERLTGDLTGSGGEETYEMRFQNSPGELVEEDSEKRISWWYRDGQLAGRSIYDRGELVSEERLEYDDAGNLAGVPYRDAVLSRVETDFQAQNPPPAPSPEVRTVDGWIAPRITLTYDPLGNLIAETNSLGEETRYQYTSRGQVKEIEYADGTRESRRYSKSGYLVEETSRAGKTTTYTLDGLGRVLSSSEGDEYIYAGRLLARAGDRVSYEYDAEGRPTQIQRGAALIEFEYDDQGRRLSETIHANGEVGSSYWAYDDEGRVVREWSEAGGVAYSDQSYVYDPGSNVILTMYGDGLTTETRYDERGRPICHVDPAGGTTITSYDDLLLEEQRVHRTSVTDPSGMTTILLHDGEGRLVREEIRDLLDRCCHLRDVYYDLLGRVVREEHLVHTPDGPVRTYTNAWTYGTCGRLLAHSELGEAQQSTTNYGHDEFGRITSILRPGGAVIEIEYDGEGQISRYGDYAFTYDSRGNVVHMTSPQGTITRDYDLAGRLSRETFPSGLSVAYEYDDLDRITALTLPDGSSVTYEREGPLLRSVRRQSDAGGYEHCYLEYDPLGRPTLEKLPLSAGELARTYDARGCCSIQHAQFREEVTSRDAVGNPIALSTGNTYSYDDRHRLSRDGDREFTYDSLHNRLDHVVDGLNRLPECDLQGNLLGLGGQHYSYDALGRLSSIQSEDSRVEFTYDASDRCLSKTSLEKSSFGDWVTSSRSDYFYMGMMELGSVIDGEISELRILGVGIGGDIGAVVAIELDGAPYVPVADRRGCIRVLLDGSEVVETYEYTAFGEETASDARNPYRFMSKRTEGGLVNFGHRFYVPSLGRFLTADPARDGANLYAFVRGNPVSNIDLFGYEGLSGLDSRDSHPWADLPKLQVPRQDHIVVQIAKWVFGLFFGKKNRPLSVQFNVSSGTTGALPGPIVTQGNRDSEEASSTVVPVKRRDGSVPPSSGPRFVRAGAFVCYARGNGHPGRPIGAMNYRYAELDAGDYAAMVRHQGDVQENLDEACCSYTWEGVWSDFLGVGYLNGIVTTFDEAFAGSGLVSDLCLGMEVDGAYNGTGGFLHDTARARRELFDFAIYEAANIVHGNWDRFFARADPRGVYLQFCHSEGAIIVRNALMCYDPELRKRIIVIAIAPAAYMIPGTCREAVHLCSASDLVPRIDTVGRTLAGNSVVSLTPHPSAEGLDHALFSPTYSDPLAGLARKFIGQYLEME